MGIQTGIYTGSMPILYFGLSGLAGHALLKDSALESHGRRRSDADQHERDTMNWPIKRNFGPEDLGPTLLGLVLCGPYARMGCRFRSLVSGICRIQEGFSHVCPLR